MLFKDNPPLEPPNDKSKIVEQVEDDESIEELEIEENIESINDNKAIVEFNIHSNNSLLKSSGCY